MRRIKRLLSTSKDSKDHFRFFDLPAELRERIYDLLDPPKPWTTATVISWPLVKGPTHTTSPDQKFQRAHIEHKQTLPLKKYLLINRRFRDEILHHCLRNAWLVIKFYVDADQPPVLSDRVLSRTIAAHVLKCKLQFSYRNLLGKLRRGHSDQDRAPREDKISYHLGIAINSVLRQMPALEICHYQVSNNFDFKFNLHHDSIMACSAHLMSHSCLQELLPAPKPARSVIELVERQKSADSTANMAMVHRKK